MDNLTDEGVQIIENFVNTYYRSKYNEYANYREDLISTL
jgi:hypothetical protein